MFTDPNKDLIVITTESKWDETPRMRHYIAHQLSRFFNVLFIELYSKGLPRTTMVSDSLVIHRLGGYIRGVNRFSLTKNINDSLQAYLVCAYLKRYNATNIILLNFRFDFWQIYTHNIFKLKYFFLNDDFVNMTPTDTVEIKKMKKQKQNKVLSSSYRIFTCSEPLAEDVREINDCVSIIHSGHDFSPENNKQKTESDMIHVCFMGFIHENLEIDWIERLANEHKIQVTFVGPIESKPTYERLIKFKNIHFCPPLISAELQEFISKFDVFIMPYTLTEINTKASVPAKLFQYLACGRPIVSSLMPHLIQMPEKFVYQSDSAENFVHQIYKAYCEDNQDLYKKRIDYATCHTWNERGNQFFRIIEADKYSKKQRAKL